MPGLGTWVVGKALQGAASVVGRMKGRVKTRLPQITSRRVVVNLALFLLFALWIMHQKDGELATARAEVVRLAPLVKKVKDLEQEGLLEAKTHKATVDSLWWVASARADSLRNRPKRQWTPRGQGDALQYQAERDTALMDLVAANSALADVLAVAGHIRVVSLNYADRNIVRATQVLAVADTTLQVVKVIELQLRPSFWRRFGGGLKAAGADVGKVFIGYTAGNLF